jgi:hypothetical protein
MSDSRVGFSYGGGMNVPPQRPGSGVSPPGSHGSHAGHGQSHAQGHGQTPAKAQPHEMDEPIELVEDEVEVGEKKTIRSFGVAESKHRDTNWKRTSHVAQTGAVRMRSFHGRLSEQGLEYMDHSINEWLDGHPEIEVKFVTSTVGMFEGKIKEPALILNVWY